MPSTFVHALIPPSCLFSTKRRLPKFTRTQLFHLFLLAVFLSNAADLDIIPAALHPHRWKEIHRFWGHNVFMLSLWVGLGSWYLRRHICEAFSRLQAFWISFGLVASHVFLDAMGDVGTDGIIHGVPLLYPFSRWEFILPFRVFKAVPIDEHKHFLWALITARAFWHRVLMDELLAGFALVILWIISFSIGHAIYARLRPPSQNAETAALTRTDENARRALQS